MTDQVQPEDRLVITGRQLMTLMQSLPPMTPLAGYNVVNILSSLEKLPPADAPAPGAEPEVKGKKAR